MAAEWAKLDAGRGLTPPPNRAGPHTRPESSVMRRIGINVGNLAAPTNGLWGVRGPGLLAFAAFLDPRGSGQAAGLRQNFERRLRFALQQAAQGGGPVWVNLVASTAGGTGAGTFLPITLWLRWYAENVVNLPSIHVALVLFWWTTFANERVGGRERSELLSKGKSGSYAILRELQLLDLGADVPEATRFPERTFPLWQQAAGQPPVKYQLNSKPFDRVFWIGLRDGDTEATKTDVYEEGSRLVQVLSNPNAAGLIAAATGHFGQRQVVSMTSVDYPRLRVAQRLSGELVEGALAKLVGDPLLDPVGADALRDQGGAQPNPFEAFVQAEWNNALSREKAGNATANPDHVDTLVKSLSADPSLTLAVERNERRVPGGYGADETRWQEYCVSLRRDLERQRTERSQKVRQAAQRLMVESADHFRVWLGSEVLGSKLAPANEEVQPSTLATVDKTIAAIAQDVQSVQTFFDAKNGVSDRVPPDPTTWRFRPVSDIEAEIKSQHDRVLAPPPDNQAFLGMWGWIMVAVVLVSVTGVTWYLLGSFFDGMGQVLLAVLVGIGAAYLAYRQMRRSKKLEERREDQENQLFVLYDDLIYREAADALFARTKDTFVPVANRELTLVAEQVERLRDVYAELQGLARNRRVRAAKSPLHSVDQVGFNITLPQRQRDPWITKLATALRVSPQVGTDRVDLTLSVQGIPPVMDCTVPVAPMAEYVAQQGRTSVGELPGQREFTLVDKTLDDLGTTILREVLPQTFEAAMEADGYATQAARVQRMQELLHRLMHRDALGRTRPELDPRRPSLALNNMTAAYQLLLVPDAGVASLVMQALTALDASTRDELRNYMPMQGLSPMPEIGPSVVTLTIWQANNMLGLREAQEAQSAYYKTAAGAGNDPWHIAQDTWNFQMLPEPAAAASIEMSDPVRTPLHPLVVSRLLGSDPDSGGPTLIELFYLLRHRDYLRFDLDGEGADMRSVFRLRLPDAEAVTIYSEHAVRPIVPNDPWGGGDARSVINGFDAFCDFMFCDGAVIGGPMDHDIRFTGLPYGANLHFSEWTRLGARVLGQLQRAVVEMWYRPGNPQAVALDRDAIVHIAGGDANGMPPELAVDWLRAVRHLAETGAQKRQGLVNG